MPNKDLGERISIMRRSRKISQIELAKKLGVSQSAVAAWETGRNEPNLEMLDSLADIFNVPMSALLNSEEQVRITGQLSKTDYDRLEALHQNPRLGMLFDRQRKMSNKDIDAMLTIAKSILNERNEE